MTLELDQNPFEQLENAVERCSEISFQIATLTAQIAKLNTEQAELKQVTMPKIMKDLGLKEHTLPTGETLKLSKTLNVTLIEDKKEDAYTWLRANNHGSVIKHEVSITFTDDKVKDADGLVTYCQKKGYVVKKVTNVPWNTLSAAIRKYPEEKIKDVPIDTFKLSVVESVTIKI